MSRIWISVIKGVRYREHPTRKVGRSLDRYYAVRYRVGGKTVEEGVGWVSEGYSDGEAIHLLNTIRRNIREGQGPQSLREMRDAERSRIEEERSSVVGGAAHVGPPTFRTAAELWLEHAQGELRSWRSDEGRVRNHLLPLIGDMPLDEIDSGHIRDMSKRLVTRERRDRGQGPLADATVRQCVVLCGRILEFARTAYVGPDRRPLLDGPNPAHGVRLRKRDNSRWRILSDDELSAILEYCRKRGGHMYKTVRLCVLVSVRCGARREEVLGIRREHMDRALRRIRVVDTKNGESRFLYPPDDLFAELEDWDAAFPDTPWLFPSEAARGKPVHKDALGHYFAGIVQELGLNEGVEDRRGRLVFHSLRHTFGTRQIMAGVNPLVLKRLMGHKTLSTTERYVHVAEDFLATRRDVS